MNLIIYLKQKVH